MGGPAQEQARAEYDKAMQMAQSDADRFDYQLQKAITWVRENNFEEADKAFLLVAVTAHAQGFDLAEAQAHRMMSMYQSDDAVGLKHLETAEEALGHQATLSVSEREEERARILRYRAVRADHSGNHELADKTLQQLESMATGARGGVMQNSYHAAAGALLVSKQNYGEAIPHLEEDSEDPYSMEFLSRAYSETGASDQMHEVQVRLRATNVPTMERALVVPALLAKRPETP